MAYSRAWSNVTPSGSALANTVDDEIRNLRVDIQERLDTILGAGKWATDPIADLTSKVLYIPGWAGMKGADTGVGFVDNTYGLSLTNNGNAIWFIPIVLPQGCTITGIQIPYSVGVGQTLDANFTSVGGATLATPISISGALSGNASFGALTQSTNTAFLGVSIKLTAGGTFSSIPRASGLIVTYTKPTLIASI